MSFLSVTLHYLLQIQKKHWKKDVDCEQRIMKLVSDDSV